MLVKNKFILFLTTIFLLCGCSASNDRQCIRFDLCDYKNIDITADMYLVTDSELNTAMTMYAVSTDTGLEDYTGLTDAIVNQYFGYDTVIELKEKALLDIVSHRIIDAIYAKILSSSYMDFHYNDPIFEDYYARRLTSVEHQANQENMNISDFLKNHHQITEEAFKESEIDFYVTICIIKEILNSENHPIPQSEINSYRSNLALELGCSIDETHKSVLDEDLFYAIAESTIYELIEDWYMVDIHDAYDEARQSLDSFDLPSQCTAHLYSIVWTM